MKTCANKECGIELTEENCYKKSGGYFRAYCKVCHNNKAEEYNKLSSKAPHRKDKINARKRAYRKNPEKIAAIILADSKNSDKKHNRECDLDREFIEGLIGCGCLYCGETELRITLDRIDNSKGHLRSNVVPACIRCNYARGSMPHAAWMCLMKGLTEAREKGLFGDWTGRCR
jgi:5-methylcytosine-specific restriction endonuclease McrA